MFNNLIVNPNIFFFIIILFNCFGVYCLDPAPSWLNYALAKRDDDSECKIAITRFYAETTVPDYPVVLGIPFCFWIGIEPRPASFIFQPILPQLVGDRYEIFSETFSDHTGQDIHSESIVVKPGTKIFGLIQVTGKDSDGALLYSATAGIVGQQQTRLQSTLNDTRTNFMRLKHVLCDAYVVFEHRPHQSCLQLPPNNQLQIHKMRIDWSDGKSIHDVNWQLYDYKPRCNSSVSAIKQNFIQFNWNSQQGKDW
jgi:hypothetical protein